jgi:prepilin signal peptidase PulO-like enzyme (type II secretory pathway)
MTGVEPLDGIGGPAAGGLWLLLAALAGAAAGWLLDAMVGRPLDAGAFAWEESPPMPGRRPARVWMVVAMAIGAAALWWWECVARGLDPVVGNGAGTEAMVGGGASTLPVARFAAHMVLGWLLAAAAWIDIRHRVIPDCVTVPGVLAGLVVVWLVPHVLLPVGMEVPRSFAPPLVVPDVLAWFGGLRTDALPAAMGPAPQWTGLLMPMAIFSVWWAACTVPFLDPAAGRRFEPRTMLLPAGLAAIVAAWLVGGERFAGLGSALVGLAISAGLVWSVREGASRAMGREAMGLGDVTLMAMVGAWIGWQASVLAFFLAAFIGLAHGLVQLVRHRENELPYGPSLCLASGLVIVAWRPLWQWAGGPFSQPLTLALVLATVVVLTALSLAVLRRLRA